MKKTIIFCLFVSLISASVCFAQDWEDADFSDFDDIMLYSDDAADDEADSFVTVPDDSVNSAADYATAAANSAESAAAAANSAGASAAAAAESANSAEVSAAAAANSAAAAGSAAVAPPPPPQPAQTLSPPQPPVRVVIPMANVPPAQPVSPPAVQPVLPQPVPLPPPASPVNSQPSLPVKVIPAIPNPYSNSFYRIQVGAFSDAGNAKQCFSRLQSAGLTPAYEPYDNVNRIVVAGIRAADVAAVVQRLAAAGFNEVWIREEK